MQIELVIKIPEKWFDDMVMEEFEDVDELCAVIQHGTPLPKGHGRLIDANAIVYENECQYYSDGSCTTNRIPNIDATPTIIEADYKVESEDKE